MNIIEQIKVNDVSIDGYQGTYYSDNPEYVQVTTDSEGKILEGIKSDGTKHIGGNLIVDGSIYNDSFNEIVEQVVEDIQEQVDEMLESAEETLSYFESVENSEWLSVTTDSEGKILGGRKTDGTLFVPTEIQNPTIERIINEINTVKEQIQNIDVKITEEVNESQKDTRFSTLDINDLTVFGQSTKINNKIHLYPGINNKAVLQGGFDCAHWEMFIVFKCIGENFHFIAGKDNANYGVKLELKVEDSSSKYVLYNDKSTYENDLDFSLNVSEQYCLRIFFDITSVKRIGFELIGNYNEYFTHTYESLNCNGYGLPFLYSNYECEVLKYNLSANQKYYDLKNVKCAVWGHSYIEGDSLHTDRIYTFTNLLAEEIGEDLVLSFGLGGDTIQGMYDKMQNGVRFAKCAKYGLICIGANDRTPTSEYLISKITDVANTLINKEIIPIFFTICPVRRTYDPTDDFDIYQPYRDANAFIRSNYNYVDMEQVFLDCDAINDSPTIDNIKRNLYLNDKIHPNVEGHRCIYNRIKLDCPYLF